LNFIGRVVLSVTPGMLDAGERNRAEARDILAYCRSVKSVDAACRLERDADAGFGHDACKIASHRMLHWTARAKPHFFLIIKSKLRRHRIQSSCSPEGSGVALGIPKTNLEFPVRPVARLRASSTRHRAMTRYLPRIFKNSEFVTIPDRGEPFHAAPHP